MLNRLVIIILGSIFLVGCASHADVPMSESFWQNKQQKVTVAAAKAPKPQLHKQGPQGLLDVAIANAMTNDLDKRLQQIDLSWYHRMPTSFGASLKQRGVSVVPYNSQVSDDQKEYTRLAINNSDKVLVIKLEAIGAKRDYYAMVPTGAPQGYCVMSGELINVADNKVLWRYTATSAQPVQGAWDQPPAYPNLTNAIELAANSARQELLDSFFSGH